MNLYAERERERERERESVYIRLVLEGSNGGQNIDTNAEEGDGGGDHAETPTDHQERVRSHSQSDDAARSCPLHILFFLSLSRHFSRFLSSQTILSFPFQPFLQSGILHLLFKELSLRTDTCR
jgi:hypothetical protein